MARRFMKVVSIVLPFITVVILASQLLGAPALTKSEMMEELQQGQEVLIEYVEPQTPFIQEESGGSGASYDYTSNTYTSPEEAEIGLISTGEKSNSGMSDKELYFYFQLSFDSCLAYEGNSYEDQIKLELKTLRTYCQSDAKQLPDDYSSRYESWRAKQSDSRYGNADTTTTSIGAESQQTLEFSDCNETVYATSQVNLRSGPGTSYDKVGGLSGGQSATRTGIGYNSCDGWSRIQLSDGSIVYVSSNYLSTTKPVQQQQVSTPAGGNGGNSSQQTTTNGTPSPNSNLANSGLDFSGPKNIIDTTGGKTQEQIDQEVQEMLERTKDEHFG